LKLNPVNKQTTGARPASARIWEIDFLRGLSIILMVFYHVLYDLSEMGGMRTVLGIGINLSGLFWLVAQNFFAGLFIILCGISSTLSRSNIRRALKLLGFAVIITAVTYIYNSSSAIHFGILHCLGVCILIYGLTFEKSKPLTCVGVAAVVFGLSAALFLFMRNVPVRFNWLLPLGITSTTYTSLDYFPLLPWLGVYLAGAALGKSVYARRQTLIPKRLPETFINAAGRHSLLIYIIHQPVILAALYLAGLIRL
jgi:uncharacterized membrane protein